MVFVCGCAPRCPESSPLTGLEELQRSQQSRSQARVRSSRSLRELSWGSIRLVTVHYGPSWATWVHADRGALQARSQAPAAGENPLFRS